MICVVGIGGDGWDGLGPVARAELLTAEVVVGAPRQLDLLPQQVSAERVPLPRPLRSGLPALLDSVRGKRSVVLASGDPLLSGIGSTLIELLGVEQVRVLPQVSSVTLARARMGWPAEDVDVVSLVGRTVDRLRRQLSPGRRLIVLSADESSPATVAQLLRDTGFGDSELTVLAELGSGAEIRLTGTAAGWSATVPRLNLICLTVRGTRWLPTVPGLPDEAFEHDGQLTKRDLRASALARLAPAPGHLLWDIGAGAGSVAIEWLRTDPRCAAVAVERDPLRLQRIARNADRLGVPSLQRVAGSAPQVLTGLPQPDAVFVGGGLTAPGLIDTCWQALAPGGRLVAHAVTAESEALLLDTYRRLGGELSRIAVERAEPLGSFTGWRPARTVTQYSVVTEGQS